MNFEACAQSVDAKITEFLVNEGGYANGYLTFVGGAVLSSVDEGKLVWSTPVAQAELTERGKETRAKKLYKELVQILRDHDVDRLEIRATDIGYGSMRMELVYVTEVTYTVGRMTGYTPPTESTPPVEDVPPVIEPEVSDDAEDTIEGGETPT